MKIVERERLEQATYRQQTEPLHPKEGTAPIIGTAAAHANVANERPINCSRDVHVSITSDKRYIVYVSYT
jgi:hypothetical protein